LGLCVLSLGLTMGVNVPMNNRLDKVGDPDTMSPQALADARRVFENPWVRHNLNRLFVSLASCGTLCWALLAS
ncbi:anthrone oxygenase family protein, partial [Kibdelosporangium lantanae]